MQSSVLDVSFSAHSQQIVWLYVQCFLDHTEQSCCDQKKQTRICFIFVEATALFCDDSCSWVQAQVVQAGTTWFGTPVQDPHRQSAEAGRLCVNWGEPLNLWSKAYLKEREELVGKKKWKQFLVRSVSQCLQGQGRKWGWGGDHLARSVGWSYQWRKASGKTLFPPVPLRVKATTRSM